MISTDSPCLIGVDGGGTSCRFRLEHAGERREIKAAGANYSTDPDGSAAVVRKGLEDLAARAGLVPADLAACRIHVGLAGVMNVRHEADVIRRLGLPHITASDDQRTSVVGALGDADGALAAIGTGSFCARKVGGEIRRAGGWGLVLSDEASGAWLGRGLLSKTLRAVDGLAPHSSLTRRTLAEFGDDPAEIVSFAEAALPADFAALAPGIVAAAADGDAAAAELLAAGADRIQNMLRALGWSGGEPLCLIGGLGPHYTRLLSEDARRSLRPPRGDALDGAVLLAAQAAATGDAPAGAPQ